MIVTRPPKIHHDPTPLQRVADRAVTRMTVAVQTAIMRVRRTVTMTAVRAELATSGARLHELPDWSAYWTLTKAEPQDFESLYYDLMLDGAAADPQFGGSLTLINERAVQAAQLRSAELVVGIERESREAMRQILGETLNGDYTVDQAARLIRDTVGLTPDRSQAVVSYRNALERMAEGLIDPKTVSNDFALAGRIGRTVTGSRIDQLVSQYAQRQVRDRALTIARTETMRAAHDGQRELWRAAADSGLIDRSSRRVWVTTADDRLCSICAGMDGQTVALEGEQFVGAARGFTADLPPIHPKCRCTSSLEVAAAAPAARAEPPVTEMPNLKEAFPKARTINFEGMTPDQQRVIAETLHRLGQEYPEVAKQISTLGSLSGAGNTAAGKKLRNDFAVALADTRKPGGLVFNDRIAGRPPSEWVGSGKSYSGVKDPLPGLMTHEFGHFLYTWGPNKMRGEINAILTNGVKDAAAYKARIVKEISEYGAENIDEAVAEAFNLHRAGKAKGIAKEIGETIDKYMKV